MAELLKNIYNPAFFNNFLNQLKEIHPTLDKERFLTDIFSQQWEEKALKQRMRHVAETLGSHLPENFKEAVEILLKFTQILKKKFKGEMSLEYMFLPDFIEVYGMEDISLSLKAMEEITKISSAEFAVRPFILAYPETMEKQMLLWSKHPHDMVRRLASEGYRPRLPWGQGIPFLKKDPSPILPILEILKNDPSETVRRSVANNLNDISKDHPNLVLEIAKKWKGTSPETDKLIKHACRTLLKKADPSILSLFGVAPNDEVNIQSLALKENLIKIGNDLFFEFTIFSEAPNPVMLRVEYAINYLKANGKYSLKKFKITENTYQPRTPVLFKRKQSFRDMTTRKHYHGPHQLSVLINGKLMQSIDFDVIK